MLDLAKEIVSISEEGLRKRAKSDKHGLIEDETHFLTALKDILDIEKSPADEILELYFSKWNKKLESIFETFSY